MIKNNNQKDIKSKNVVNNIIKQENSEKQEKYDKVKYQDEKEVNDGSQENVIYLFYNIYF